MVDVAQDQGEPDTVTVTVRGRQATAVLPTQEPRKPRHKGISESDKRWCQQNTRVGWLFDLLVPTTEEGKPAGAHLGFKFRLAPPL